MTTTEQKTELSLLPTTTALELFESGGVRSVLDKIKAEVLSIVTDPTTDKGRREIASLAYKVAQTKTAMDSMGKSLTEEQRQFIDRINAERRIIVAELDALKEQVRKPLTEYEEREKARIAGHESRIAEISNLTADIEMMGSAEVGKIIAEAKGISLEGFDEFRTKAETTLQAAIYRLESRFTVAKEDEDRRAREEAERVERERVEREAREAKIAAEAAEKARLAAELEAKQKAEAEAARVAEEARKAEAAREAERKAEADRLAALEREKVEAIKREEEAKVRHSRELKEAAERAEREAAEKEKARLAEIEAARLAEEKRAANKRHREKILAEIASDLSTELHLEDQLAGAVAAALASGKIRHASVQF